MFVLGSVLGLVATAVLVAVAAAEAASTAMVRDGELLLVLRRETGLVWRAGEGILAIRLVDGRLWLDRLRQGDRALIGRLLSLGVVVVGVPCDEC